MNILILGDIVGSNAISHLRKNLWKWREQQKIDFTVANGENASDIHGLSSFDAQQILDTGVDLITLGNHAYGMRDLYPFLDSHTKQIIRPANYPSDAPGEGYTILSVQGWKVLFINLLGTAFMENLASPFETLDRILSREDGQYDFSVLDFHAEATSEKAAMGYYADGRVSVVFGTHTHVPTSDGRLLPKGSAYITDIGMTGPVNGILGTDSDAVLQKFLSHMPSHFHPADGPVQAQGIVVSLSEKTLKPEGLKPFVG